MNTYFLAQANAGGGMGAYFMPIVFIALIVFSYFAVMRPQKKQQQARVKMMSELKKGDRVILMSGLHGKVDAVNKKDDTVVIDADGLFLTFSRTAIRRILPEETEVKAAQETVEAKEAEASDKKEDISSDDKK